MITYVQQNLTQVPHNYVHTSNCFVERQTVRLSAGDMGDALYGLDALLLLSRLATSSETLDLLMSLGLDSITGCCGKDQTTCNVDISSPTCT